MASKNMGDQFTGLPMESLIGAPLKAACDSQVMLARSTVDFIDSVGFITTETGGIEKKETRTAQFSYTRHVQDETGEIKAEDVDIQVPVLAIVNIPSLVVDEIDVTFDMEVKSSESSNDSQDTNADVKARAGWGAFSAKVTGSISSHKENTRTSDNSAKYHVQVHAAQAGTPEGLSRVLDIMQESIIPKPRTEKEKPN